MMDSRYKLKTGEEVAYFPPIQNTANPYATEAAMHIDQANQLEGYGYLVDGFGAFTYLGTVAGTAADYEAFGGGNKQTQSLTGANLQLNENNVGIIYNEVTPSASANFDITSIRTGGVLENYIDTTGKTVFPTITNSFGNVVLTKGDVFKVDTVFKMYVLAINATDLEYFFIDYLGSGLIDDSQYIKTTGAQTKNGVLTFTSFPRTPGSEPQNDYDVANKKYVQDNASGIGVARLSEANIFTQSQNIKKLGAKLRIGAQDYSGRTNNQFFEIEEDPNATNDSNPRKFYMSAHGSRDEPGWLGAIVMRVREGLDHTIWKDIMTIALSGVSIDGNLSVSGAFIQNKIDLQRNSVDVLSFNKFGAGTQLSGSIKTSGANPAFLDHRIASGAGGGWSSGYRWYSQNGTSEKLGFTIRIWSGNQMIVEVEEHLKVNGKLSGFNSLDLSNLGSFANDSSAATGGVAIGYAYINSSTGAMHRRLT